MQRLGDWLVTRVVFVGGEAWRIRCSGVRHASQGWGASDAGESSLASATRARPEDSGRQEARWKESSHEVIVSRSSIQHINLLAAGPLNPGKSPYRRCEVILHLGGNRVRT